MKISEMEFWLFACIVTGLMDTITTIVGIQFGAREINTFLYGSMPSLFHLVFVHVLTIIMIYFIYRLIKMIYPHEEFLFGFQFCFACWLVISIHNMYIVTKIVLGV